MKKESFLVFLIWCTSLNITYAQDKLTDSNPIQIKEVTINGHINNYQRGYNTGGLIYLDAVTRIGNQEVFYIDSLGNFKMSFELISPTTDCTIEISKTIFSLYLVPGGTYNITFNLGNQDDYSRGIPVFTGESGKLENDVCTLRAAVKKQFLEDNNKLGVFLRNDSCEYQSFEDFCEDLTKRKLAFIDEYCKKRRIDPRAIELIKTDLSYEPAWALILYPYISTYQGLKKRKKLPPNFYQDLFDKFQINNPDAIGSNYYSMYIANIKNNIWENYKSNNVIIDYIKKTRRFSDRELFLISKYLQKDTTITNTKEFAGFIDEHRSEITQYTNKYLTKLLLDSIGYFPSGIGRDLIISQGISSLYLRDQTNSPSPDEWNRIDSLISNGNIYAYLRKIDKLNQAKASSPINNKTNILPPLLKNEADKVFEKLIGVYHGKVVYLDFWATWCGPCRQEIPYSKILSSHFEGQEVVFLSLCCKSDKKNLEAMIKSEQMIGDQYLLSDDEFNMLSKLFSIHEYPTYALIDKEGNIIDKNAPRPSEGGITIKTIESLLIK